VQALNVKARHKVVLRPLLEAGLVEKIGSKKTGRYALRKA
jgi:hypothetical protein